MSERVKRGTSILIYMEEKIDTNISLKIQYILLCDVNGMISVNTGHCAVVFLNNQLNYKA